MLGVVIQYQCWALILFPCLMPMLEQRRYHYCAYGLGVAVMYWCLIHRYCGIYVALQDGVFCPIQCCLD